MTLAFTSPYTQEIAGFFYTVVTTELSLPAPSDTPSSIVVGGHVVTGTNGNGDVPEPASLLLLGLAAVMGGHRLRRRP